MVSVRQLEITNNFIEALDRHLTDLKNGETDAMMEVEDIAHLILFINPRHLSDTIKDVLSKSPCDIYQEKIISISSELLLQTNLSINEVAHRLTYDPSNFTKFFKKFTGLTPSQFRSQRLIPATP